MSAPPRSLPAGRAASPQQTPDRVDAALAAAPGREAAVRRRRRPALWAAGAVLVAVSGLGTAALVGQAGDRVEVLAVARTVPVDRADLPERCVLLFGQEGPGLSPEAIEAATGVVEITQYGSTRSINAASAAAVIMYEWCRRWA